MVRADSSSTVMCKTHATQRVACLILKLPTTVDQDKAARKGPISLNARSMTGVKRNDERVELGISDVMAEIP